MIDFLKLLKFSIETPSTYGLFHLTSIFLAIVVAIYLCAFRRNMKEKSLSKIIMIVWIVLVVLECYKQFIFSYDIVDNTISWRFQWYAFPYQFCATPLTFLPFIALNKGSNKWSSFIKESCIVFCSTYCFIAGLAVLAFPGDVFVPELGIDIQTMIHHGAQLVMGIFIYVYYHKQLKFVSFLKAVPVFLFFIVNAMILNEVVINFTDGTFNMFFISPHFPSTLPVFCDIWASVPYPIFLLIYISGLTLLAFITYNILYWIIFLIELKHVPCTDKFNNTVVHNKV